MMDLSDVKDAEKFCYKENGDLSLTTERVAFAIGDVGLGKLTAQNWKLAYARYLADHTLNGYEIHLEPEDFKRHIGLKVGNFSVSPDGWANAVMTAFLSIAIASIDKKV